MNGVGASGGTAVGPAYVYRPDAVDLSAPVVSDDVAGALAAVAAELDAASSSATGEAAEILQAQAAMARDPALSSLVSALVAGGKGPAAAVVEAGEQFAARLVETGNEYVAARAVDVRHICDAAARRLLGVPGRQPPRPVVPSVLLADDLLPADTAGLDPSLVLAIATAAGSPTTHTAIVARGMGIPAVVAVRHLFASPIADGTVVAVDGDAGIVLLNPDAATVAAFGAAREERATAHERARQAAGSGLLMTTDGRRVEVAANIRGVEELRVALEEGAEAVGLLRTELLYVDRQAPPTVGEQAALLRSLRELLGPERRLVVRTFDIGSDKQVPFLPVRAERNPELGVRGIRLAQRHPDLLNTQLEAVAALLAAAPGPTAVMAPMVATLAEVDWFVGRVEAVIGRGRVQVGVMVEVPSLVMLADEVAWRVDFLSIGTNDLTQYLMAADRRHGELAELQDPFHPAVLRAVARVCEAAVGRSWVGVCGEAASRPLWALLAVGLGVDELSMQAASIPEVRAALRSVSWEECRVLASAALGCADGASVRAMEWSRT